METQENRGRAGPLQSWPNLDFQWVPATLVQKFVLFVVIAYELALELLVGDISGQR